MAKCFSCSAELVFEKVYRSTVCPKCGNDVKVCLNCEFHRKGAQWDCREHIQEQVTVKDRANFCEYFKLSAGDSTKAKPARVAFDDLFKS